MATMVASQSRSLQASGPIAHKLASGEVRISFGDSNVGIGDSFRHVAVDAAGKAIFHKHFSGVSVNDGPYERGLDNRQDLRDIEAFAHFIGRSKCSALLTALFKNAGESTNPVALKDVISEGSTLAHDGDPGRIRGIGSKVLLTLGGTEAQRLGLDGFKLGFLNKRTLMLLDPTSTFVITAQRADQSALFPGQDRVKVLYVNPRSLDASSVSTEKLQVGAEISGAPARHLAAKLIEAMNRAFQGY